MHHQLHQNPTSFINRESKEITVPQNSDNISNTNNTTQTGTHLTRFDAEMSRFDFQEMWRQKDVTKMQNATQDASIDNEMTRWRFSRSHANIRYTIAYIPLITQILLRKISKFQASIIISRWKASRKYCENTESVPKSYHKHAHLLMKHLSKSCAW